MYGGMATYFESDVLSADPVELVRMLYRGAIDAVEKARQHLRQGDIAARSSEITRAGKILVELTLSVNREADPALSGNLVELYDYMQRQLLRANLHQADGPLSEVSQLLSTLLDAWSRLGPAEPAKVAAVSEPEPVAVYAGGDGGEYGGEYGGGGYGGGYGNEYTGDRQGQSWSL
jgi:flagellar protein FliS